MNPVRNLEWKAGRAVRLGVDHVRGPQAALLSGFGFGLGLGSVLISRSRPCGNVGNAASCVFHISIRAVLLSFFLDTFSFFARNPLFHKVFHRSTGLVANPGDKRVRWHRWGCGSWGRRSLCEPLALKCRPHCSRPVIRDVHRDGALRPRPQVALPVDMMRGDAVIPCSHRAKV